MAVTEIIPKTVYLGPGILPPRPKLTPKERERVMAPRYVPHIVKKRPPEPFEVEKQPWLTHEELLAQRLAPLARPSPERGLVAAVERGDVAALTPSMKPHATFLQRELQRTTDLIGEYRNYIISKYKIDPERFTGFTPGDADTELGKEICQRQYNFIRVIRYGTPEIVTWEEEAPLAAMPFTRLSIAQKYAPIIT